ncbi:MAG TPA: hypothetical protein RMH99_30955 [Sandaracinaceae bacterium LLY-WYZ-13_1]|nr:hypothetical protein [Sandaracinaceae bacterium LLY-WYZ-13_1]
MPRSVRPLSALGLVTLVACGVPSPRAPVSSAARPEVPGPSEPRRDASAPSEPGRGEASAVGSSRSDPNRTEPSRTERVRRARARLSDEGARVVVHEVALDAARRLHLVLEAGACYQLFVVASPAGVEARLVDEHDRPIAEAGPAGWLGRPYRVCPRWSGSFGLELTPEGATRATVTLLLARRPAG